MAKKNQLEFFNIWTLEVKWKTMWAITCLLRAASFVLFHLSIIYCTCFICCYFLGINDYALWIGVNDLIKEGKWTWISDHSTLGYSNWKRGEPNSGNEHCGEIYKGHSFTWNNAECYQLHGYICEKWWLMDNETLKWNEIQKYDLIPKFDWSNKYMHLKYWVLFV